MATKQRKNELAEALRACRMAMGAIAVASALVNILYLTGALYMLEIYDGVLASRSPLRSMIRVMYSPSACSLFVSDICPTVRRDACVDRRSPRSRTHRPDATSR